CADAGLDVVTLAADTQARLAAQHAPQTVVAGPVQLMANEPAERFADAVATVAADPGVGAVIAIFVEHIATRADDIAATLAGLELDVPLLTVFMTPSALPAALRTGEHRVPTFRAPE